ncbi:sulfurtransferase [Fusibacter tunisiensis]|uniref:thiosulfate sulfurtransferase n=1 Tax=Fusibacter tunisiensis TaxID=1008308 RepID=A0ABS2MRV0_9FIRM|nr:sulfurtransferase [Fusibacter tunisiensis]MBM7562100.1 thiosulfate/3-mercaptopyruvate sulfurtransferase [Fusibacter tunisiensis]
MTKRLNTVKLLVLSLILVAALTSCAVDTTYPGTMNVVEASKVVEEYMTNSSVVLVDARGQEAYDKGHAKGAVMLSPTELVADGPVPMTLASKEQIETVLSAKGISDSDTIYIYDNNSGVSAGRIWWTLRVYGHENVMIVNGGESALVNADIELSTEPANRPETTYTAKAPKTEMIATYEEVLGYSENPAEDVVILDVRSIAEYEAGFIPGAILYPHTKNVYADGTFMSSRDLGLFYKEEGIEKEDLIIIYCKSSFRATQTAALLEEAGYENLKVYDGAWLEWESKTDVITVPSNDAPVGASDGS